MTRLILVALVAVGAAVAVPAARGSHPHGHTWHDRYGRDGRAVHATSTDRNDRDDRDDWRDRGFRNIWRDRNDRNNWRDRDDLSDGDDRDTWRARRGYPDREDTGHHTGLGGLFGRMARDRRGGDVDVAVSRVECPSSSADVVMTAPRDHGTVEYSVYQGDRLVKNGMLWPGVQRTVPVHVEPHSTERIGVTLGGQGTTRYQVWSRCEAGEQVYGEYREAVYDESDASEHESGHQRVIRRGEGMRAHRYNPLLHRRPVAHLPYTGPPADLYGKLATAAALVVFGGLLWWVALVWPRRVPAGPLMRPIAPATTRRRPGLPGS